MNDPNPAPDRPEPSADETVRRLCGALLGECAECQQIEALTAALRLSERAMESSSEGITISDMRLPDHPLIYVNGGFERLTGHSRDEVLNRNCCLLQGPGTDQKDIDELRSALAEGREYVGELLNYRKDGTTFWNRLVLTPLRDASGQLTHYIGVQSDITQRINAEQDLRRALDLLEATNRQLTRSNRYMKRNLESAARIQRSLLPDRPPKARGIRFAWKLVPCDELAGDILNVFRLDRHRLGVYMLDVTGHGVPAALLAVSVSRMLSPSTPASSLFWEQGENSNDYVIVPPATVADRLNQHFPWDSETGQFFTFIYGQLDVETHAFHYVSAGHPWPIHVQADGTCKALPGEGLPIGLSELPYKQEKIMLARGERLYFYSDGVTDVRNGVRELFGKQRVIEHICAQHGAPLESTLDQLLETLTAWKDGRRYEDDLSMLAIEIAKR